MFDTVRVFFQGGTSTTIHVPEDDVISEAIVTMCEEDGYDLATVVDYRVEGGTAAPVRAIYVAGVGKWYSIGAYVRAVKIAKANPTARFPHGLTCWWPCTGADIMKQFRQGMHDRINQGAPYSQRGMR